jgi:sugar phosphate isomerase/epimerase
MNPFIHAPTSMMDVRPLDFLRIAGETGYDGVGLRLYRSAHLPFFPVADDPALIRALKSTIADHGLQVLDIFTFYLEPETDVTDFKPALELGAAFGARFAVVQGNDSDRTRLRDRFAQVCDMAAGLGLGIVIEFVPARRVATLAMALDLIAQVARANAAVLVDPLHLARSGGAPEEVRRADRKLFPYAQFCDGLLDPGEPNPALFGKPMGLGTRCLPGEGRLPIRELLRALPPDAPLSIEVLRSGDDLGEARAWAKQLLSSTRSFVEGNA